MNRYYKPIYDCVFNNFVEEKDIGIWDDQEKSLVNSDDEYCSYTSDPEEFQDNYKTREIEVIL